MILINVLGTQYPLTHTDTTIECCGVVLFRGTKDQVSLKLDYYKLFGLPIKDQLRISEKMLEIEKESREANIIDEESLYI